MNIYVLTHHHRHGVDTYLFRSKLPLDRLEFEDLANVLKIDFEPDREDEWMELSLPRIIENIPAIFELSPSELVLMGDLNNT